MLFFAFDVSPCHPKPFQKKQKKRVLGSVPDRIIQEAEITVFADGGDSWCCGFPGKF